jgi:hypothetical protein
MNIRERMLRQAGVLHLLPAMPAKAPKPPSKAPLPAAKPKPMPAAQPAPQAKQPAGKTVFKLLSPVALVAPGNLNRIAKLKAAGKLFAVTGPQIDRAGVFEAQVLWAGARDRPASHGGRQAAFRFRTAHGDVSLYLSGDHHNAETKARARARCASIFNAAGLPSMSEGSKLTDLIGRKVQIEVRQAPVAKDKLAFLVFGVTAIGGN